MRITERLCMYAWMRVRMPMLAPNARMRNHWATQAITARSHCSMVSSFSPGLDTKTRGASDPHQARISNCQCAALTDSRTRASAFNRQRRS
eukprot:13812655-Alexandrium_andersonii.AAC.1